MADQENINNYSESKKCFYIRTFGWPTDTILYDYCAIFRKNL